LGNEILSSNLVPTAQLSVFNTIKLLDNWSAVRCSVLVLLGLLNIRLIKLLLILLVHYYFTFVFRYWLFEISI